MRPTQRSAVDPAKESSAPVAPAAADIDAPSGPWQVEQVTDATAFWAQCERWERWPQAAASPFQTAAWLQDWYATLGAQAGVQPLLLSARAQGEAEPALLLPLVRRRWGARIELLAPDFGVSDYHAPLVRPGLRFGPASARALWSALRPALAAHGDLLRLDKMLPTLPGGPNPLALALAVRPSRLGGHRFAMPMGWELWRQGLSRQVRREGDRHGRVFARWPDARFELCQDALQAREVFEALEQMQHARLAEHGHYLLDRPPYADLYRRRLTRGLANGSVSLGALRVGQEVIAALYALNHGQSSTVVRIAFAGERWKSCAPGRLLMERCLQQFSLAGTRVFDLGVGDHAHKHHFGCERLPLMQACEALSPRGRLARWGWALRESLHGLMQGPGAAPGQRPRPAQTPSPRAA